MRPSLAISFLFVYVLALLSPMAPYINYEFNKEKIIAKYCENKDKPKLNCEGKCHLAKQIQEKSEKETENPENLIEVEVNFPVGKVAPVLVQEQKYFKPTIARFPALDDVIKNNRHVEIDYPPQWLG